MLETLSGGTRNDVVGPLSDMTLGMVIGAYNKQVEIGRTNRANLDRVNDPHRTSVDLKSKHVQLSFFGPTAE